jgi:IS30 family transposase
MATAIKLHWSFADDRHLMQFAASSKSLEEVAKQMNRDPATVARRAKRLGVSLKSSDPLKVKK